MPPAESLENDHAKKLEDLRSANEEMERRVKDLMGRGQDEQSMPQLDQLIESLAAHTATLKMLIEAQEAKRSHRRGKSVTGVEKEGCRHSAREEAPEETPLEAEEIIALYRSDEPLWLRRFWNSSILGRISSSQAKAQG